MIHRGRYYAVLVGPGNSTIKFIWLPSRAGVNQGGPLHEMVEDAHGI